MEIFTLRVCGLKANPADWRQHVQVCETHRERDVWLTGTRFSIAAAVAVETHCHCGNSSNSINTRPKLSPLSGYRYVCIPRRIQTLPDINNAGVKGR